MRLLAILACLLASCGGGGGGKPFTPSENLAQSHAWLQGAWFGEAQANGINYATALVFLAAIAPSFSTSANFGCDAPGIAAGGVAVRADGDRLEWFAVGEGYYSEWTATAEQRFILRCNWRIVEAPSPAMIGQTGTATLTRSGGPATTVLELEAYESPGLLLIVRREFR